MNSETGEKFEVALKDFPHKMNWEQARDACNGLGNSWRLTTNDEMEIIHHDLYRNGKGNFKDKKNKDYYWTSSKSPDDFILTFAFFDGRSFMGEEDDLNSVRVVRDL